jgi:hypothetical protein
MKNFDQTINLNFLSMEQIFARRKFLKNVALTSTGVIFLSSTSILQAFGPKGKNLDDSNTFANQKSDLRKQLLSDNYVTIQGRLHSHDSLKDFSKTSVEVWHLSPDNSEEYRANIKVNANGEYSFVTDFPGKTEGKNPRLFFKIVNQTKVINAELILNNFGAYVDDKYYVDNLALGDKLFPKTYIINNEKYINFNTLI